MPEIDKIPDLDNDGLNMAGDSEFTKYDLIVTKNAIMIIRKG